MLTINTVSELQKCISDLKKQGKTIGFAPTMGALHEGHLSLIAKAKSDCDISICSIFVNPTQFNDPKDLEKYPRTEEKDSKMLLSADNDILFLPSVNEIYPPNLDLKNTLDFGAMAHVMEGAFRPGHFDGMAQVVKRLLDIVQPNRLFMGQKDFQQFSIVQNMLVQLKSDIQLVMCETTREKDGLAMSSRNVRLSEEDRKKAPIIYKTLLKAKQMSIEKSPDDIKKWAMTQFSSPDFKPEYFDIVDGKTLQPISSFKNADFTVACVATWLGGVRLIDNIVISK
jgi:pantoate--beta-alanine ligase